MRIDDKLIEHLEELSQLTFTDKERTKRDLEEILSAMSKLSELETEGVPERSHPFDNVNSFRDDTLEESVGRELILKNASGRDEEMFTAPVTGGADDE